MLKQEDRVNPPTETKPDQLPESSPPASTHTDHQPPTGGRTRADRNINEKYIQQVLEIEREADGIYERAVKEAEQIPVAAQKEAQEIIERAKSEAQEEARKIAASTKAQEESARILSQSEDKVRRMKTSASSRTDMAVHYILDQVAGKE